MFKQETIDKIHQPFPKEATNIYKVVQDARDGTVKVFTGRATPYIIERLNEVFGYSWNFEVKEVRHVENWGALATVRITVKDDEGNVIVKEQAGGCQFIKDGAKINAGDTFSGAITAALSKTASLFGVGLDAYKGKLEADEEAIRKFKDFEITDIEKFKHTFWTKANSKSIVNEGELTTYVDVALEVGVIPPTAWDRLPRKEDKFKTLDIKSFTNQDWQTVMWLVDAYDTVYAKVKK